MRKFRNLEQQFNENSWPVVLPCGGFYQVHETILYIISKINHFGQTFEEMVLLCFLMPKFEQNSTVKMFERHNFRIKYSPVFRVIVWGKNINYAKSKSEFVSGGVILIELGCKCVFNCRTARMGSQAGVRSVVVRRGVHFARHLRLAARAPSRQPDLRSKWTRGNKQLQTCLKIDVK